MLSRLLRLFALKRSKPLEDTSDCDTDWDDDIIITPEIQALLRGAQSLPGAGVGQSASIVPGSIKRARSVEPGLNVPSFHDSGDTDARQ